MVGKRSRKGAPLWGWRPPVCQGAEEELLAPVVTSRNVHRRMELVAVSLGESAAGRWADLAEKLTYANGSWGRPVTHYVSSDRQLAVRNLGRGATGLI